MNRLADKVAIITGAGSGTGIGAVTARVFAAEGASVVVTGREEQPLRQLAQELTDQGLSASYAVLDVSSQEQWEEVVGVTLDRYGRVDILINNAGTSGPLGIGWDEASLDEVDEILRTNLNSQYLGIKAVAPHMERTGGGSVVNIGSAAGVVAFPDVHPGYAASKGASRMLTKSAGVDFASRKIRVNSVLPGLIETPMSGHFSENEELLGMLLTRIPLGRMGRSEEIAQAALFLAGDESSYVTGTDLLVDGGYTAI
ncbi:SDR family oxidoreductase [Streptomyces albidoflavus]|uniref:SDR family NAD(P)-dependent oxidoreductase n=1 Tax=Streptomyces albidoflavus TaxID=1886 RepID=UPI0033B0B012